MVTYRTNSEEHERRIQILIFPSDVSWSCKSVTGNQKREKGTNSASFDNSRSNTNDRYKEDAGCVVVILIKGPEHETRYLKNVEGVKCLCSQQQSIHDHSYTYLVD
jgi:hypothetical protein